MSIEEFLKSKGYLEAGVYKISTDRMAGLIKEYVNLALL